MKKMDNLEYLKKLFSESNLTLGSVESFTGGLFASSIVSLSGASLFFKGSLVTYASEEKNRILGISQELIDEYGVVSKQIASQMSIRGREILNVDYCVSFTGNAGPTCMENKPVGEIYIGISSKNKNEVFEYHLNGSRSEIRKKAIDLAIDMIINRIK